MICFNCNNKSICKYYDMTKNFPGELDIKSCLLCTNVKPATVLSISKLPSSEPAVKAVPVERTPSEIMGTMEKLKAIEQKEKKQKRIERKKFKGTCSACKKESDELTKCDVCGAKICPECATEDIMDHNKTKCPKCYG